MCRQRVRVAVKALVLLVGMLVIVPVAGADESRLANDMRDDFVGPPVPLDVVIERTLEELATTPLTPAQTPFQRTIHSPNNLLTKSVGTFFRILASLPGWRSPSALDRYRMVHWDALPPR